jgi:phosphoribosylformylglycinamidine synthase
VAVSGARPVAVTDCLNFGSPEDPAVMWQFERAVTGLADGCRELGIPVTGGNVSLYNQTGDVAILPTPLVGVLGVIDDVASRVRSGWLAAGHAVWLLGVTRDELDGSAWADVVHGHLGGVPPQVDLDAERRLAGFMVEASSRGLLASAHDVSDGGVAQALVESCVLSGVGASVEVTGDVFVGLFSESAARAVVSTADEAALLVSARQHGVPAVRLGATTADPVLAVGGLAEGATVEFPIGVDELREVWSRPLRAAFSH